MSYPNAFCKFLFVTKYIINRLVLAVNVDYGTVNLQSHVSKSINKFLGCVSEMLESLDTLHNC